MRTAAAALKTNLAQEESSLTWLFSITRADGEVIRLSMSDSDVEYDGQTWLGDPGFTISSLSISADGTPAATDIEVPISTDTPVLLEDVHDGLYGGAVGQLYVIDYNSPSDGAMAVIPVVAGEVRFNDAGLATLEFLGLADRARDIRLRTYQVPCPNQLGDDRCTMPIRAGDVERSTAYVVGQYVRVPSGGNYQNRNFRCTTAGTTAATVVAYSYTLGATTTDGTAVFTCEEGWTRTGTVTAVANNGDFTVSIVVGTVFPGGGDGDGTFAQTLEDPSDDIYRPPGDGGANSNAGGAADSSAVIGATGWFDRGALKFTSGDNDNLPAFAVKKWTKTSGTGTVIGRMTLWIKAFRTVSVGDTFEVYPGCDKSVGAAGCTKFDNINNHAGFPFMPGDDFAFGPYVRPPPPPPPPPWGGIGTA